MPLPNLESKRLIMRPFRESDLEDMYEYASNPNVSRGAGFPPPADIDDERKVLERFASEDEVWALELKASGKVIGSLGLHPDRYRDGVNARMLGYSLSEPYWNMGLATEASRRAIQYAFEELGLDILSVYHFSWNTASKRVIEKCGFTYEGTRRRAVKLPDGSVTDDSMYSMLREEWEAKSNQ